MEGLLTPISTYRASEKRDETKPARKQTSHSAPKSAEDALEILRHEPDYDSLVSALRLLAAGKSAQDGGFNITSPGPLSAQIVQVLVSEIAPNYWTLLKEDSDGGKASSPFKHLLGCLGSITGVNSILVRLRALIQEARSEVKGVSKRPDISMNLRILLDLLCHVLEGDDCVWRIWNSATASLTSEAKIRPLAHEFVSLFGSGRVVSLSAEAAEVVTQTSSTNNDGTWPADALKYTQWLGRNILRWLESRSAETQAKVWSELFVKALHLGHSELLVKSIFLALVPAIDTQFRVLLEALRPTEQRKVLFTVLRILSQDYLNRLGDSHKDTSKPVISSSASAISNIMGSNESLRSHLVEWLTSSSGAGLGEGIGIRRAVLAVVAQDKDSIVTVLEKSISQFGDQLYIKHSPILQQEVHAQVLLLSAGYAFRKSPMKLTMLMRSSVWLNTISNRLSAPHQRARFLGMVVGEALSGLVDKGDKRLDFHMEETNEEEGKWYKGLTHVADEIGTIGHLFTKQADKENPKPAAKPSIRKQAPVSKAPPKLPQQGFIIEELSDEEMDDDDLPTYAKPDSDEEDSDDDPTLITRNKPKAPVYIRDLITYLRDTDNYDRQKLALATAPPLIRRKAGFGTEVSEHAEELASLLIGLQDKFEIDSFDELRAQGMVALIVAQAKMMAPWFAKTFFDGDYSISQRAAVLVVLGLGARELAGFETSTYATGGGAFPSKRLPEKVENLFLTPQNPSDRQLSATSSLKPLPPNALETVTKSLTSDFLAPLAASAADSTTGPDVLKLSTFTSRLEENQGSTDPKKVKIKHKPRPRIRNIPNTTAQLLYTSFFSPLTARFQAALHSSSSRTRGILFQPYLLSLYLKTLALLVHASGPSTLSLPEMTAELWRILLSTTVRAHAVGDLPVTQAILFGFLAMLDVNEGRMRDLCSEMGREVVEAQEWVADVFRGLRGGDGAGEEADVKMLAAGVLVRLNEGIESYQLVMVGDLIGFG
ncbi:DNA replication checkpoint protein tel2 [Rhypophila decipiens]